MNKNEYLDIFFKLVYHKKKEIFYPVDSYLYHYTDLDGMIGIVSKKCIYSVDSRFLNDLSEQKFTKEFILDYLKTDYKGSPENKLIEFFLNMLPEWEIPKTYITSFSKDSDSLSMWRGYGKEKIAFSLGFGKYFLKQITNTYSHLVNVIYDSDQQKKLLNWIFDSIFSYYKNNAEIFKIEDHFKLLCSDIKEILTFILPMFKNPKFSEEQEARLIIRPNDNLNIQFKSSQRGLIQFVETDLKSENFPFLIEEIKIGPTSQRAYLKESLYEFLTSNGLEINDKRIKNSVIPYRDQQTFA